jgi:diketogulonate reductase-like aldo/keto reductase
LTHLDPVLKIQEEHGILTASYGPLTPILRNKEGPLTPILERIAQRLSEETGKTVDPVHVLVLWTKAKNVVVVTASGNPDRIKGLAETLSLPDLKKEEVEEIEKVGRSIHFRHYAEHMSKDFPAPDLPSK